MNTKTTKKADAVKTMIKDYISHFEKCKRRPCEVVYLTKDQFSALGITPGAAYDGVKLELYH